MPFDRIFSTECSKELLLTQTSQTILL